MKGTDLFLQVLTDRLGLNTPQAAAPVAERRGPSRATVVVGGLAAGVLLSSLCSGQTLRPTEGAAPAVPAATAPAAAPAAASAPAEAPAPAPTEAPVAPATAPAAAAPAATPAVKTWTRPAAVTTRTWKPAPRTNNRTATAPARAAATPAAAAQPAAQATPVAVKPAAPARATAPVQSARAVDPESLPIEAYRLPKSQQAPGGNLFFDVFGKLIVVIGLMFACAAGWKKLQGGQGLPGLKGLVPGATEPQEQALEVVETYSLAPQRQLHLVKVSGHRLLVGSTPQSVSLIADLDAPRPEPVPVAVSIPVTQPEPVATPEPEPALEPARPEVSRYDQIMHLLREQGVEIPAEATRQPETPAPTTAAPASGLFGGAGQPQPRPANSLFTNGASGAHRG